MDENSEERENVLISCPGCGQSMILKDDTTGCLTCPNEHTYTLETLLLGQTLRVETLLHAAVQFLHQQESIVRGMALRQWPPRSERQSIENSGPSISRWTIVGSST